MKKAYVIIAHKYPEHLCRLIERLDDGQSTFYVHIDLTADISPFDCIGKFGNKVKLVERANSGWATIGQIHASLNALREIVGSGEPYEMVHLLSGQDYPIKSNREINAFFEGTNQSIFLEYFAIPNFDKWANGGSWRVDKYFLGLKWHHTFLSKAMNLLSTYIPFLRRTIPNNMKPYAGSCWFSISLYAVKYILDYIENHPEYERFHQYTFGSDELFYLMILLNSSDEKIRRGIQNNNLRLIKWKHISSANPETLTISNFEEIKQSNALFARKFNPEVDAVILDRIDSELLVR